MIFCGCGENTQSTIVPDIRAISIDQQNITLHSTDLPVSLSASILYDDNSTQDATDLLKWSSSNQEILSQSHNNISGGIKNGGDANITVQYAQLQNTQSVHVDKLIAYTVVHPDINATGTYIFEAKGNFDNNDTNITIHNNIVWSVNNDATLEVTDGIANITFITGETNVTATLFGDTNSSSPIAPQTTVITIH